MPAIDLRNIGAIYPNSNGSITVPANMDITGTPAPEYMINGVPIGGAAGANGNVQYNNNGSFAGSANLFWDNANARLGIGTAAPQAALDVIGNIRASDSMLTFGSANAGPATGYIQAVYATGWSSGLLFGAWQNPPYGYWIQLGPTPIVSDCLSINPSGAGVAIGGRGTNSNGLRIVGDYLSVTSLPSAQPPPGFQQFWYDPADGNRVKFEP